MSNFKVGDKVRAKKYFIDFSKGEELTVSRVFAGSMCTLCFDERDSGSFYSINFELVDNWSIYSNTLPLSELSDEQAAELFNHWCNGGATEVVNDEGWCDTANGLNTINRNRIYRARQKSERELFIDAVSKVTGYDMVQSTIIGAAMFNAGFEAPKVGE